MSFLWKLVSRSTGDVKGHKEFEVLRPELQQLFSNGVKYNMKLVIRGARRSGKSSLFARLKGEAFTSEYHPTDAIQVACIRWNYELTDEVVKVEVWDVVDDGRPRELNVGSMRSKYLKKMKGSLPPSLMVRLDSKFVDVYKGACGVIMIFDINSPQSFEYVRRELPHVPSSLPLLLLGNFRDIKTDQSVQNSDIAQLIRSVSRQRSTFTHTTLNSDVFDPISNESALRYCESSMLNGFGLIYVHRFLNIPFLTLQRTCLLRLLAENTKTYSELQRSLDNDEKNDGTIFKYDMFIQHMKTSVHANNNGYPSPTNKNSSSTIEPPTSFENSYHDEFVQPSSHPQLHVANGTSDISNSSLPIKYGASSLVAALQGEIDLADSQPFYLPSSSATHSKSNPKSSSEDFDINRSDNFPKIGFEVGSSKGCDDESDDDGLNENDVDDDENLDCDFDLGSNFPNFYHSSVNPHAGSVSPRSNSEQNSSSQSSPSVRKEFPKIELAGVPNLSTFSIDLGTREQDAFERFLDEI